MEFIDPELTRVIFPWILRHPRYLKAGLGLIQAVRKAKFERNKSKENGLKVPPFLILSMTSDCNLQCNGCFAHAAGIVKDKDSGSKNSPQLDYEKWRSIISEASGLGVMGFIIAGGEPFLFPGLLDLCLEFPDRIFVVLTNGTALAPEDFRKLKRSSNISILVSIEGGKDLTDDRRGKGVYESAVGTMARLNKIGIPWGISVTVNRNNFEYWMDQKNIDHIIKKGVRVGVFIEYIPISHEAGTDFDSNLMLTRQERLKFRSCMVNLRNNKPLYIIHSPGDEEFFGGCVSAGRGFAHVTPQGDLTPCPVSNIATHNLTTSSLMEGLASPLFEEIRNNEHLLENDGTPCSLFAHPREVEALVRAVGGYRTY